MLSRVRGDGVMDEMRSAQTPDESLKRKPVVALLEQLGCSLVITNDQSSTVVTFSSLGDGRPVQMFARFPAGMGLWLNPSPDPDSNSDPCALRAA